MNIIVDGVSYEVVHSFTPTRVIINIGLYVIADQAPDGTWDESGTPASPDEEAFMKALTAPTNDVTVVVVTKDE